MYVNIKNSGKELQRMLDRGGAVNQLENQVKDIKESLENIDIGSLNVNVKKDWNENNPDDLKYIENRTHYVDTPAFEFVWSKSQGNTIPKLLGLIPGRIYACIGQGSTNNEVFNESVAAKEIENNKIILEGSCFTITDNIVENQTNISGDVVNITIVADAEGFHELDERFIPHTIARVNNIKTIFGENCEAGNGAFVFGNSNIAAGDYSLAGGRDSRAITAMSMAMGNAAYVSAKGYKILNIDANAKAITVNSVDEVNSQNTKLAVGVNVFFLHKESTWNITNKSTITAIDKGTNTITLSMDADISTWTVENTPYLMAEPKRYTYTMTECLIQGPDAYELTAEQVSQLKANGIFATQHAWGTAMNHVTTAFGNYAFAINNRGTAIGNSSFAGGQESIALGGISFSFGEKTITGLNASASMAFGRKSHIEGTCGVAAGLCTIVLGDYSVGFGIGNNSWDDYKKIIDAIADIYWTPINTEVYEEIEGIKCYTFDNLKFSTTETSYGKVEHLYVYKLEDNTTKAYSIFEGYTPNITANTSYNTVEDITDKTNDEWLVIKTQLNNSAHMSTGRCSAIFGSLSKNFGNNSIVTGENNYNYSRYSFVHGSTNKNYGYNSSIFGKGNTNAGDYSVLLGSALTNYRGGKFSVIGGSSNKNYNAYNAVFGLNNTVKGQCNFVAGRTNESNGVNNFIIGRENITLGELQFAIGQGNVSESTSSQLYMIGKMLIGNAYEQTVLGVYNAKNANARLIIGDGDKNTRANAMEIIKGGNINFPKAKSITKAGKEIATEEFVTKLIEDKKIKVTIVDGVLVVE